MFWPESPIFEFGETTGEQLRSGDQGCLFGEFLLLQLVFADGLVELFTPGSVLTSFLERVACCADCSTPTFIVYINYY